MSQLRDILLKAVMVDDAICKLVTDFQEESNIGSVTRVIE